MTDCKQHYGKRILRHMLFARQSLQNMLRCQLKTTTLLATYCMHMCTALHAMMTRSKYFCITRILRQTTFAEILRKPDKNRKKNQAPILRADSISHHPGLRGGRIVGPPIGTKMNFFISWIWKSCLRRCRPATSSCSSGAARRCW
jgi:hypothetical protein